MTGRPFLDTLDQRARADLHSAAVRRAWPAGATLFHEGDRADRVLILVSGLVKAVAVSEDGSTTALALRGPGEILGELAAVDGGRRSASVVAVEDVEALALGVDAFGDVLRAHPDAALVLLASLADRLRDASRRQAEFGSLDTSVRLARTLVELADAYGEETTDGVRLRLLSQEELASFCGASREAIARGLRTLRDAGLVRTGRRVVTITDTERMRTWSG